MWAHAPLCWRITQPMALWHVTFLLGTTLAHQQRHTPAAAGDAPWPTSTRPAYQLAHRSLTPHPAAQVYDPVLAWARSALGWELEPCSSILVPPQSDQAVARVRAELEGGEGERGVRVVEMVSAGRLVRAPCESMWGWKLRGWCGCCAVVWQASTLQAPELSPPCALEATPSLCLCRLQDWTPGAWLYASSSRPCASR